MPILTVSYSDNVSVTFDSPFFKALHQGIAEIIDTQPASCKSFVQPESRYFIGDCLPQNGCLLVKIAIRSGRTEMVKQALARFLAERFSARFEHGQLRVEVCEISDIYMMSDQ